MFMLKERSCNFFCEKLLVIMKEILASDQWDSLPKVTKRIYFIQAKRKL